MGGPRVESPVLKHQQSPMVEHKQCPVLEADHPLPLLATFEDHAGGRCAQAQAPPSMACPSLFLDTQPSCEHGVPPPPPPPASTLNHVSLVCPNFFLMLNQVSYCLRTPTHTCSLPRPQSLPSHPTSPFFFTATGLTPVDADVTSALAIGGRSTSLPPIMTDAIAAMVLLG
jgi:hypothetical protein